jgi:hypothetical protein
MTTSPASASAQAQPGLDPPAVVRPRVGSLRSPRPLSYAGRIVAWVLAWILLVVGLAGLVLPGIQGVLTLALSATFFSLTSTRVHERLRSAFRPWPKGWRRVVKVRRTLERWLGRLER